MEKKKQSIVIVIGIVIIVILSVIIIWETNNRKNFLNNQVLDNIYVPENSEVLEDRENEPTVRDWEETEFRQEVPIGSKVPEVNEAISEELKDIVAVPNEVVKTGEDSDIRTFKIRGEGGKFIPWQITAYYNDTVHIDLTAVDGSYDFILEGYNMKQTVNIGQTKALEFQAIKEGRFLYYCELCGGPESDAVGEIIIKKK
jgi:heme/copper-type cytochrome/quinol oxidase subunit 2